MTPRENFRDALRRMPWWGWLVLALLLVPVMTWLAGQLVASPRDQIEETIRRLAGFVEDEEMRGLADHMTPDFADEAGLNREEILAQANQYFGQVENIDIDLKRLFINITGTGEAEALVVYRFSAVWLGSGVYNRVPVNAVFEQDPKKPEKVYVRFRHLGDKWRVEFLAFDTLPWRDRFEDTEPYY